MSWRDHVTLKGSPIGIDAGAALSIRVLALVVAIGGIAFDLWVAYSKTHLMLFRSWPVGLITTLVVGGALLALARGDRFRLGLRCRPVQGWWYWVKATMVIGVGVFALMSAIVATSIWAGYAAAPGLEWQAVRLKLWMACVNAPVFEEGIYRLCMCVGFVGVVGRWPTVAIGGAVFALLHFVYGNPGADNFLAGYLLGWAYFRSGTIIVPIVLHSLGNLCVLLANVFLYEVAPVGMLLRGL